MANAQEFDAIGTHWTIDLPESLNVDRVAVIMKRVRDRIDVFDQAYSRFRADSLVTTMSQAAGRFVLPDDAAPMMALYRKLYDLTEGAMTPLIGRALSDAGYDAEYSLASKSMVSPKPWDEVMKFDGTTLEVFEPVLLDFAAAGKGYCIDLVAELLVAEKIESFCVDAGGDIRHCSASNETLRVGLENPVDTKQVIGVTSIVNKSICGSAGNRRAWGNFHHILDPRTLQSPRHILAVWVVADSTMLADGLTTALMFVDPSVLQKEYDFAYAILNADFSLESSPNFPGEFFTA